MPQNYKGLTPWQRAVAFCHEAAEWAPDGKVIPGNLGTFYRKKYDWVGAHEVDTWLLPLEPTFPEAWYGAPADVEAALGVRTTVS